MNILYIINNLRTGGAERQITDIALSLKQKGHGIVVLTLTDGKNLLTETLKSKNVEVISLGVSSLYNPKIIFRLAKFIKKNDFDLIHTHLFPSQYWLIFSLLITNKKVKVVTTEHSSTNSRRKFRIFKLIEKTIYSRYDRVISINETTKESLVKWHDNEQTGKFVVINNGVELEKFRNAIPFLKQEISDFLDESSIVITMVGRFEEPKDQTTMIRAIRFMKDNTHLIFVGDGSKKIENEKLASDFGLLNRVHFLGERSDVARILQTSDINVLSSKWEGLSLAAIEAMASGKPFVASDVDGLRELAGKSGVLFKLNDERDLAEKLEKLIAYEDYRKEVAYACKLASEKFSLEMTVEKHIELYTELLNEK